ncbi:unnamed protein product, partial [Polarella glacialis]
ATTAAGLQEPLLPTRMAKAAPPALLPIAPWLPARRHSNCLLRKVRDLFGLVTSLLLLLYMLILGLLLLVLELPRFLLKLCLRPAARNFGHVVEYAYSLRICRLHVLIGRKAQQWFAKRPYHSRFADIRTTLRPIASRGLCFVHAVPCLTDNFCYVLVDASEGSSASGGLPAVVVDPCDATAVEEALELIAERFYSSHGGICLEAVLCTHKHWDHAGGNEQLLARARSSAAEPAPGTSALRFAQNFKVFGGLEDDVPGCTDPLQHGDRFEVGHSLCFEAVAAPGHTVGSIMYKLPCEATSGGSSSSSSPKARGVEALFAGDTLFSGGCGAQFEGDELDIKHSFATILETSDPAAETLLFPGHEYTAMLLEHGLSEALNNSAWASSEPPDRFMALCSAFYVASHRRALRDKLPTVPVSLTGERAVNPHFDHGLRKYADTLFAACEALEGSGDQAEAKDGKPLAVGLPQAVAFQQPLGLGSTAPSSDEKVVQGGHFHNGHGPSPAQQLAVLYKADIEVFRQQLLTGRLSGAEAAARLSELERRTFEESLLTGGADCFSDQGLEPEDVEAVDTEAADDAGGKAPETPAGSAGVQGDSTSVTSNEESTTAASDNLPSELEVTEALKVLAVLAFVPVGPKAPCKDKELPVSLKRLETVLTRLQIPTASIASLLASLVASAPGAESTGSSSEGSGSDSGCRARSCFCQPERRYLTALRSPGWSGTSSDLLPLRCALGSLLPPEAAKLGFLRRFIRWCFSGTCGSRRASAQSGGDASSQEDTDQEAATSAAEAPPDPVALRRRRVAAVERRFSTHRPDRCALCTSSFSFCEDVQQNESSTHKTL